MQRCVTIPVLLASLVLVGCRADLTGLQTASVEELASWNAQHADFTICDANSADTRERYGVIPGAVLLSNYRDYEPETELPADTGAKLVFYCHSEYCGAAADAARKAIAAGYRDVWVMAPGIEGWKQAGQPVDDVTAVGGAS